MRKYWHATHPISDEVYVAQQQRDGWNEWTNDSRELVSSWSSSAELRQSINANCNLLWCNNIPYTAIDEEAFGHTTIGVAWWATFFVDKQHEWLYKVESEMNCCSFLEQLQSVIDFSFHSFVKAASCSWPTRNINLNAGHYQIGISLSMMAFLMMKTSL